MSPTSRPLSAAPVGHRGTLRRRLLATLPLAFALGAAMFASVPAQAQLSGAPLKAMLADASDRALDRLSQPGAFSSDQAIRIALPGLQGRSLGKLMGIAGQSGLTGDLDAQLNRAAEQAAAQAKPIFRAAIDRITFKDALTMVSGSTGATDYLRQNTQDQIQAQLLPLVQSALSSSGALTNTKALAALGMGEGRLAKYVADKTSDGIFQYVGQEETKARANPLETGKNLLKGFSGKF